MSTTDLADALRKGFAGEVVEPGQPGYDESRRQFNPTIARRAAVVARCATTADVVAAVNTAREHQLLAAVRCGGHSFSRVSTCDDGILIDLRGLKSITVDPQAPTPPAAACCGASSTPPPRRTGCTPRAGGSPPPAWAASPPAAVTAGPPASTAW